MNDLQRIYSIDTHRFKYVWNYENVHVPVTIRHPETGGLIVVSIHIPYGMLSDGASGVRDLDITAFFPHDRLYISPWVTTQCGNRIRLNKKDCDLVYCQLLAISGHEFAAWFRFRGLYGWRIGRWTFPLSARMSQHTWDDYRMKEEAEGEDWWIKDHTVPHALSEWEFPTMFSKDAVFIGKSK